MFLRKHSPHHCSGLAASQSYHQNKTAQNTNLLSIDTKSSNQATKKKQTGKNRRTRNNQSLLRKV